ncbi:MAG: homoserine dehydrogenase [Candidatus Omnitrophota bacterium]
MRTINVGLIGFGTIGVGVVQVLLKRKRYLQHKNGFEISLKKICDKDLSSKRDIAVAKKLLTKDTDEVLTDPEIDIVIELIGGIHPAKEIVKKALANGKYVVTANKALLCEEGKELFDYANSQKRCIRFEGAVGGGIPIIKALKESLVANNIQAIYGIVNGTSNYILWRMQVDKYDFKKALTEAQKLGFAERNAAFDVDGTDSAHKLALLALLGFGKSVTLKDIYVEGITDIQPCDIEYAKELGYCIKLLAVTKRSKDQIELRVHPTLLEDDHPLSAVRSVYNAIYVKGDCAGECLFYGKGAGRYPTTSAVVADVIDLAKSINQGVRGCDCNLYFDSGVKKIKPIQDIRSRYYIRFQALDRPGVLASIANVLANYNISISSVKQVERRSDKVVPIVMLTHEASEKGMAGALKKINMLSCMKHRSVAIRIESL